MIREGGRGPKRRGARVRENQSAQNKKRKTNHWKTKAAGHLLVLSGARPLEKGKGEDFEKERRSRRGGIIVTDSETFVRTGERRALQRKGGKKGSLSTEKSLRLKGHRYKKQKKKSIIYLALEKGGSRKRGGIYSPSIHVRKKGRIL